MGVLTDAATMHLVVQEANVQESIDYDFLVALYFELHGMILDMEKHPSPLAQYQPLLEKLNRDQGEVANRIDELMMSPEEIYLAEYFNVEEEEEDDWKELTGPHWDGSEEASYFVTGTIHWEFEPWDADELMEITGETWDEVSSESIYDTITDMMHSIHKWGETSGSEDIEYGTISYYVDFGSPEANT